jgi:hypothetical protein
LSLGVGKEEYSDACFLSEDRLLVYVNNQQLVSGVAHRVDTPESKVVVLDVQTGRVLETADMRIEKEWRSVHPLADAHFLILNRDGISVCDERLQCGAPRKAQAPISVSPGGTRIAFSEVRDAPRTFVVDGALKDVASFDQKIATVFPGDGATLVFDNGRAVVKQDGKPPTDLGAVETFLGLDHSVVANGSHRTRLGRFSPGRPWQDATFLNRTAILAYQSKRKEATVTATNGSDLYAIPVEKPWRAVIVRSQLGERFGVSEYGNTASNSLANLLDIYNSRPPDDQRVRVYETQSGKQVAEVEWNPNPRALPPALSPSGHRLAGVTAGGILKVWQID